MSVLETICEYLDGDQDSFLNLTEKEIIRIEKRLKAELNLNKNLDINDIDLILVMLRNHRSEFVKLFSPVYDQLRQILMDPEHFVVVEPDKPVLEKVDEKMINFISDFFYKDLNTHVSSCFKLEHYNGLNALLIYVNMLPGSVKEEIIEKCLYKIEFATECLTINASNLRTKIRAVTNPYFFRCLNKLNPIHFEEEVRILSNKNVKRHENSSDGLFSRIMYAIGFFNPVKQSFASTVKGNQKVAYNEGVREILYSTSEPDNTGATYELEYGTNWNHEDARLSPKEMKERIRSWIDYFKRK